jgi:hypothetical protein
LSLNNLGTLYRKRGIFDQARACHQQSLRIFQELGDRHGEVEVLLALASLHKLHGHPDQALAFQQQGTTILQQLDAQPDLLLCDLPPEIGPQSVMTAARQNRCPGLPKILESRRRSFRWSFHHGELSGTGPCSPDDPPDLSCRDGTYHYAMDGSKATHYGSRKEKSDSVVIDACKYSAYSSPCSWSAVVVPGSIVGGLAGSLRDRAGPCTLPAWRSTSRVTTCWA